MAFQNYSIGLPAQKQGAGSSPNAPGGLYGEGLFTKLMPDYYNLVKNGLVYSIAIANINPSAFTGGAAGTPIFGIYNPLNSGKDLVFIQARTAIRTPGVAAVASSTNFYAVNQGGTAPTGTQTQARSSLSFAQTGSVAYVMSNTANTGVAASNLLAPFAGITAVVTTASQQVSFLSDQINGLITLAPGMYLAYGLSVALTTAGLDASLIWAEIPT